MKKYINKYVLMMIGMVLIIAMGVIQNIHEDQMSKEAEAKAAAVQQQQIVEQGQKAKTNTQWKIDHHGTIPAFKD